MVRTINSAKFIHQITFLENLAKNDIDKDNWSEKFTSFAEIKPICDNRYIYSEGINFGNVVSEEYFSFRIRYVKDINSDMRIKFRQKLYGIKRILDADARGRVLNIIGLEII